MLFGKEWASVVPAIGYWFEKEPQPTRRKGVIVNRVGDLGFALGVMLILPPWRCF
jgi:NADH:ubiquinone oxidoreductase subunit 5 (subunit L)/multisubunit Na+/H+ antiporter MnhA subunit